MDLVGTCERPIADWYLWAMLTSASSLWKWCTSEYRMLNHSDLLFLLPPSPILILFSVYEGDAGVGSLPKFFFFSTAADHGCSSPEAKRKNTSPPQKFIMLSIRKYVFHWECFWIQKIAHMNWSRRVGVNMWAVGKYLHDLWLYTLLIWDWGVCQCCKMRCRFQLSNLRSVVLCQLVTRWNKYLQNNRVGIIF